MDLDQIERIIGDVLRNRFPDCKEYLLDFKLVDGGWRLSATIGHPNRHPEGRYSGGASMLSDALEDLLVGVALDRKD